MTSQQAKFLKLLLKTEAGRLKYRNTLTEVMERRKAEGQNSIDAERLISTSGMSPEEQMQLTEIVWESARCAGMDIQQCRVN